MSSALITGNSSGLGLGFSEVLLQRGWQVYGCSRRGCPLPGVVDRRGDLADAEALPALLAGLLHGADGLDLVVLNAGVLGDIKDMHATSLEELRRLLDINLWANKLVMDWLLDWGRPVAQVVAISSGASVLGNRGWGGYALSKAALNMLMRLYAHEFPGTHLCALAPGLIDTAMADYLCSVPDPGRFPALERIRTARGSERMPGPREAAELILDQLPRLRERPSGEFVDIREFTAPEEYAALRAARQSTSG